ncbi:MAG: AAA family ATPase [Betaproteobacteria bacterium]
MSSKPVLILVAGGPGAGKTALGRALARRIASAVLLDKDVLCGAWVDAMLERLNEGQVDRDSRVYWNLVRPLEYSALLDAALDNLALGKTVIVVAPFGPELRDDQWLRSLQQSTDELRASLRVLWIETDAAVAKARMSERHDTRDDWKLANWNEFAQRAQFGPPKGHILVLRNSDDVTLAGLEQQAIDILDLR